MSQLIIGLGGKAGSGKSTAAAYLQKFGFVEFTISQGLKQAAAHLFDLNHDQLHGGPEGS